MNRKEELNKMIYSLIKQIESFEREIREKTFLKIEAVKRVEKYKKELEELGI